MEGETSHSTETNPPECAFVSFLAGNTDKVKGVVGLAKGLKAVNSKYHLVVLVLGDVPGEHRNLLTEQGCIVHEIESVAPPSDPKTFGKTTSNVNVTKNYSKLTIWKMMDYRKIVYLDGNLHVLQNIDELFALPNGHVYGVKDCFCGEEWSETPQHSIKYCQQDPSAAMVDEWLEALGPEPPIHYNTDVIVFEPNVDDFDGLLEILQANKGFSEQDCINKYFEVRYKAMKNKYNLDLNMLWHHPDKVDLKNLSVVNFCIEGSQPWNYSKERINQKRKDLEKHTKKKIKNNIKDIEKLVKKWKVIDEGGLSMFQKSKKFVKKVTKKGDAISKSPWCGVVMFCYGAINYGASFCNC